MGVIDIYPPFWVDIPLFGWLEAHRASHDGRPVRRRRRRKSEVGSRKSKVGGAFLNALPSRFFARARETNERCRRRYHSSIHRKRAESTFFSVIDWFDDAGLPRGTKEHARTGAGETNDARVRRRRPRPRVLLRCAPHANKATTRKRGRVHEGWGD